MKIKFDRPFTGRIKVTILSATGRVIFEKTFPVFKNEVILKTDKIRRLSHGAYFLCLTRGYEVI